MTENSTTTDRRIAVVIGSTRPTRICPEIAGRVLKTAQQNSRLTYEPVDLAKVALPFLDEPRKPALGQYEHEHTRRWSRTASGYDGFLFVLPQYNWGYPAVLKNALDFLYAEWRDKPAAVASYGTRGGNRAVAQLRGALQGLHMRIIEQNLELVVTDAHADEDELTDVAPTLQPFTEQVRLVDAQLTELLTDDQQ
ncbi:NADPH-dependent FMN reductase [Streptomyces sp. NPDC007983]|uniref:NADPH-dependent FMN reductase n=1 Tax=Streptomyces sp. NPDC007983 TaxID=3364800 RepID=UPI0036EC6BB4